MKNLKLLAFLLIPILILFSCEKDPETITINESITSDKYFCTHNDSPKTSKSGNEKQLINVNGTGWTPCEAADLKIFVPDCLSNANEPGWNNGIMDAINNYNNVPGTGLNMRIVPTAAEADIVLNCTNTGDVRPCGRPPVTDCLGGFVDKEFVNTGMSDIVTLNLDLDFTCAGCPNPRAGCTETFVVMHELFHALGFFHNEDFNPNAVDVPGTPINNDPNSVINGGNNVPDICNLPCNFSNFDIIALQTVFPPIDICDCPELIEDPCDCPELIEDPCDCPELFPDITTVTCYCQCFEGLVDGGPIFTRTEIPCGTERCDNPDKDSFFPCRVITECEIIEPDPEPEPECYCECVFGGITTTFEVNCNDSCETNGFGRCVKRYR